MTESRYYIFPCLRKYKTAYKGGIRYSVVLGRLVIREQETPTKPELDFERLFCARKKIKSTIVTLL
jgi:hypothetical protein